MTRIGRAIAVAIATTALAACSSSSTPVPTATSGGGGSGGAGGGGLGFTADALCALVTSDDVGAAIGNSVGAGVPSGVNAPSCTWTASNAAGATIAATDPGSVGQIPFGLQGISGAHVAQVPNLGDAAYFAAGASGPNVELDISKGGRAVTITVGIPNVFDQGTIEAAELAIGTAAAKNM
ncbi:MAG TPA: hypothetical protein VEG29_02085 [Candidatus Binatia bacterium]|nr:hypothetical protein [Candidatus Binatia bacterium]